MKLLDCLPEKEKKSMPVKKFGRGEILFHEDMVCKGIGILISGRVKIVSYSFSGGEIVYKRLSEGEMFGANVKTLDATDSAAIGGARLAAAALERIKGGAGK
jgi:signal-transduction protein with cAMP-binding, CBS, and nucleotidyltransferase domain